MLRNFLPVLALLTGLSMNAQSPFITYAPVIDVNEPDQGGLRPRIALNGAGEPIVLWGRNAPNANRVAVWNGSGFDPGVQVNIPGEVVPAVGDWLGSSIAAVGNTVWVVMKATPEDERPIYVRRSDDGGMTWGDTLRVEPNNGLLSRFPSIAVVDPDEPIVQYMEFDHGFMGARQVVVKMTGGVFGAPIQVSSPFASGNVCDCCPNQVVADQDRVVALYRDASDNERVIWGAFSNDGGGTFPIGAKMDTTNWIIFGCPSTAPDGYITGDSIRYVWMSGALDGAKVYIASAGLNEAGAIGDHRRIHSQPETVTQNFPRIAGSGDTLGVVWMQNVSGQLEIQFSWSTTGISGLSEPDTVNVDLAGMQTTPDIAFTNGSFHIVWGEMGQVRYRKATLGISVGVPDHTSGNEPIIWPNPADDILHLGQDGWVRAEIIDMNGRLVSQGSIRAGTIDVSAIAPGGYLLKLVGRDRAVRTARFEKR